MTKRVLANHAPMMKRIAAQRRRYLSCLEAIPLANAPQANDDILPAQQGKLTHPTKGRGLRRCSRMRLFSPASCHAATCSITAWNRFFHRRSDGDSAVLALKFISLQPKSGRDP